MLSLTTRRHAPYSLTIAAALVALAANGCTVTTNEGGAGGAAAAGGAGGSGAGGVTNGTSCGEGLPGDLASVAQAALDATTLPNATADVEGMVVAVFMSGQYYVQGFGDAVEGTPMPSNAIFDVGSVQKPFYWLLLHRLADQNHLDMTDPISEYVTDPALPGSLNDLTQHSTGLLEFWQTPFLEHLEANNFTGFSHECTESELVGYINEGSTADVGPTQDDFTPGQDYHYTAWGPYVASLIVEAAMNENPRDVLRREILDELDLGLTSIVHFEARPNVTPGHLGSGAPYPLHTNPDVDNTSAVSRASGGQLFSNPCDVVHFAQAAFNGGIVEPDTLAEITSNTIAMVDVVDTSSFYQGEHGRGLQQMDWAVDPIWGHEGTSIHGHTSGWVYRPSDGVAVAVSINMEADASQYIPNRNVINAILDAI